MKLINLESVQNWMFMYFHYALVLKCNETVFLHQLYCRLVAELDPNYYVPKL